jgi:L-rhamnose mutarotase
VKKYCIFLLPLTRQLFAYVEVEDDTRWAAIAGTPECRRWWLHMADLMPHGPDGAPLATDLEEVFYLG